MVLHFHYHFYSYFFHPYNAIWLENRKFPDEKKKIKDLLIGSNNAGKVREIKQLLPKNINVYSIIDYKLKSPKETGKTFCKIHT